MGGPPAVSVAVATVAKGDVPVSLDALGTVTTLASVTVKTQISGYLVDVPFKEGQMVHKGDVLAQIDDRLYQASLAQYQGQLQRDQALLKNAQLDLVRYTKLNQQDSISHQNVDTQAATVKQDEGTVAADQALVDTQKLDIAYCRILSPVTGRVGLRLTDAGNYVQASDTTGIAVVTQLQPISVLFSLPQNEVHAVAKRFRAGASLAVTAYGSSGTDVLATGRLATLDNEVDTTTGTLKLRALFDNADESLIPNQFVNVELLADTLRDVIVAPTAALLHGTPGTYVYRLGDDGKVSVAKVETGAARDGKTAVLSGLAAGDRIVTDGLDRLRDGASVTVVQQDGRPVGAAAKAGQP